MTYRNPVSIAELVAYCNAHSHIKYRNHKGAVINLKINGKVRTWKRDANRIEIPVKFGLYEYGTLNAMDIGSVLIRVDDADSGNAPTLTGDDTAWLAPAIGGT